MGHRQDLPNSPEGVLFALSVESAFTLTETSRADSGYTSHRRVTVSQNEKRSSKDQILQKATLTHLCLIPNCKHPGVQRFSNITGRKEGCRFSRTGPHNRSHQSNSAVPMHALLRNPLPSLNIKFFSKVRWQRLTPGVALMGGSGASWGISRLLGIFVSWL